jgi:hypothetical protein
MHARRFASLLFNVADLSLQLSFHPEDGSFATMLLDLIDSLSFYLVLVFSIPR